MVMVLVEARVLGKKQALVPEWSVPVPTHSSDDGDGELTLRQLIARIVRGQVAEFCKRQEARRFVRALSEREIAERKKAGKIDAGGTETGQVVDPESAVAVALQAFEDGLYLVLLDGVEQVDLDRSVFVNETTRMVFLRLTFLAGG